MRSLPLAAWRACFLLAVFGIGYSAWYHEISGVVLCVIAFFGIGLTMGDDSGSRS